MATGQTYAERAVAVAPVTALATDDLIRVDESLITVANFITEIIRLGTLMAAHLVTAADDTSVALDVRSFDTTPAAPPFKVTRSDAEIFASISSTWASGTIGIVSAKNVLDDTLFITANQTEPAWSNGQYWLRPRV